MTREAVRLVSAKIDAVFLKTRDRVRPPSRDTITTQRPRDARDSCTGAVMATRTTLKRVLTATKSVWSAWLNLAVSSLMVALVSSDLKRLSKDALYVNA